MPRSRLRRIAYHSVEASREPWICSHGRGGGVRPSARPASTSWRMVATWPSLVSMKNTPTPTEPSGPGHESRRVWTGALPPVAASSDPRVPGAHHGSCVLATDDDPRAKPDATHDRDH